LWSSATTVARNWPCGKSSIDNDLKTLVIGDGESKTDAAFQRVTQRAVIHALSSGREEATGANVLVAIFAERESPAAYFLQEQGMTRYNASTTSVMAS
jgi:ATP-dependent Clp protease ATP-binding subunit ClpA